MGTSVTLGGIKDVTSFVPSLLWFAEMYYVEFLCIKQVNCLTIARREEFLQLGQYGLASDTMGKETMTVLLSRRLDL